MKKVYKFLVDKIKIVVINGVEIGVIIWELLNKVFFFLFDFEGGYVFLKD